MNIVIVGGGTAGWVSALLTAHRHPHHTVTVVESSKIGVVGVGESTTGRMTDILINFQEDFGCDQLEFIIETGATLKYAIKHKGWTNNIDDYYLGPIDGTSTNASSPDPLFAWGMNNLDKKDLIKTSRCGYWISEGMSNFSKSEGNFMSNAHAMHVDAHLVGKYFKKVCMRKPNAKYIDNEVVGVNLNTENGNIKSITLADGQVVEGDMFIDCSGFARILMKHVSDKWISYQKSLPLNTGLPFLLKYKENEMPEPYTTAWAQKNGWMWQIPLMDRKGCGYVFCDAFTTVDKAQEEIETILGQEIEPVRTIKFDAGRQESAWVKNCLTIGLSSAFLEPLEATSIHSTIVQAHNFVCEYLRPTIEDTLNDGSRKVYNERTRRLYDDLKDFLVMHYMGGRKDSEFWRMINTGITKTDFVHDIMEMAKSRVPTMHDLPQYSGSAGWPLYSFVMEGLNLIPKHVAEAGLQFELKGYGPLSQVAAMAHYDNQDYWNAELQDNLTYNEFITHFRNIRAQNGLSS